MNKLALHISTWKVKVTVLYPHEYISKHNTDRSKLPMLRTELFMKVLWSVPQSCLTLCDPMDCNQTPFEHRIFQARMLEWVAMLSSTGSSWPRDQTHVFCVPCITGIFFTTSTAWEACYVIWKYTKGWYVVYCKHNENIQGQSREWFPNGPVSGM